MVRNQLIFDLHEELITDNFAGGGGASTGIELALGRSVDIAINHDQEAVALHAANHPQTQHFCEDVFTVDPVAVTKGRSVAFGWFSPDCAHFSKAKSGKPRCNNIRGLAWVMVKWAFKVRPRVMILENVEEFQSWGPLLADGSPCPDRKKETFLAFVLALTTGIAANHPQMPEILQALGGDVDAEALVKGLGYDVQWRELRACDYGAPTIRKRLFLIARCDGRPIVWPKPSHGHPASQAVLSKRLAPWRTAAECIDWSIPCPSIFDRKKPLAEATLHRIAKGLRKFVIECENPFIVPFPPSTPFIQHIQHASAVSGVMPINEPLRTVTAQPKGGSMAVIVPHITKYYGEKSKGEVRGSHVAEPLHTQSTENRFGLVSAFLAKHYTGVVGSDLAAPLHTVTATDHNAVVAANLILHFGASVGSEADAPVRTICAGGAGKTGLVETHLAKIDGASPSVAVDRAEEVRAFLIKYYSEGGQHQSLEDPMHTIPTHERIGLVTIKGEDYAITDIGMRMLEPHELYKAQGFPANYLIAPVVNGKRLSKTAQVRMCGNSVCPPLARALVKANVPELAVWFKGEKSAAA